MYASRSALVALLVAAGCGGDSFNPDGGVALGAAYAQSRGCYSCHQSPLTTWGTLSGQDDPVDAGIMTVYGSNLTPDPMTGLGDWADVEIIRAMRAGVDNQNAELCPQMPRYPDMSDLEARSIVQFLRSLPAVEHQIKSSMCPPVKPPEPPDMAVPDAAVPDLSTADLLAPPVDGGASD